MVALEPRFSTTAPVRRALEDLAQIATFLVGCAPAADIQSQVRRAMLIEALRRTGGNYSRAAELLRVTRQRVQQMVSLFELHPWVYEVRRSDVPAPVLPRRQHARASGDKLRALS